MILIFSTLKGPFLVTKMQVVAKNDSFSDELPLSSLKVEFLTMHSHYRHYKWTYSNNITCTSLKVLFLATYLKSRS